MTGPDADRLVADAYTTAGLDTPTKLRRAVIGLIRSGHRRDNTIDTLEQRYPDLERRLITKLVDLAREALTASQE